MLNKIQPLAFVAGATLFAPNFAAAQPAGHADAAPVIEVMGRGTVTKPAEWASITGVVRAQGKDQQTALRLMSAKQDAISSGLAELAGAKAVKIEASELRFAPILPPGCRGDDESDRSGVAAPKSCAPTGVTGSVKLTATVHPAEQLGILASLAVQLGAEEVQVGDSGVDDQRALEAEAARAAYDQALAQGNLLAGAANEHLGRLIRLNRGGSDASDARYDRFRLQRVPVAISAFTGRTPDVALKLTPAKVTETSWVEVTFELVK